MVSLNENYCLMPEKMPLNLSYSVYQITYHECTLPICNNLNPIDYLEMSSNRSDKRERNVDREKRKNDSRYGSAHFSPRAYKEMECLTLKRPSKATLEERFYKRVSRVSPELEGKIKFLDDENFNVTRYKPSHSRDEANNRSDRKGNKDFRRYYNNDLANIQEFDTGESTLESNNYKYDENRPFDKNVW